MIENDKLEIIEVDASTGKQITREKNDIVLVESNPIRHLTKNSPSEIDIMGYKQEINAIKKELEELSNTSTSSSSSFYAKNFGTFTLTADGSYHTLDLSSYIGTGVKTLLLNVFVASNNDGDLVKFANPDDHSLVSKFMVDIAPDPTSTKQNGNAIVTTNEAGEIDYDAAADITTLTITPMGYWNTTLL